MSAASIREKHDGALGGTSSIRVWLRLLSCTMAIEKIVQRRFASLGMSLPRFDVLAALDRHPDGMTMGALSRALLVSNGNVTQLVQKLARDGWVEIRTAPSDRRSSIVRLSERGRADFDRLARAHQKWIEELVGGLGFQERERLYAALGTLKLSIAKGQAVEP